MLNAQWEYLRKRNLDQNGFNILGKEGWEHVSDVFDGSGVVSTFKRRLEEQIQLGSKKDNPF